MSDFPLAHQFNICSVESFLDSATTKFQMKLKNTISLIGRSLSKDNNF